MGIVGFVSFVIFAALYNLLAACLGGVECEVKDIDQAPSGNPIAAASDLRKAERLAPATMKDPVQDKVAVATGPRNHTDKPLAPDLLRKLRP